MLWIRHTQVIPLYTAFSFCIILYTADTEQIGIGHLQQEGKLTESEQAVLSESGKLRSIICGV